MADKITKIIDIDINTASVEQLDKLIIKTNDELKKLNSSQTTLNKTEQQQLVILKQTESLNKELQQLEEKRIQTLQSNLEREQQLRENELKKNYTDQESLNSQLLDLDTEFLNKKLAIAETGSKEELEIQSKLLDNEIKMQDNFAASAKETSEKTQQRTEQLAKTAAGIGGAFTVAKSAALSFGGATGEELEKLEGQIGGLIALSNGIKDSVEGAANGFKLLQSTIKQSTVLSKIFGNVTKSALVSTGIGALLVGFGLLLAYGSEIKQFGKDLSQSLGFTQIINEIDIFLDRIGGITGAFTIIKGVITGLVKDTVTGIKIFIDVFTFDLKELEKNIKQIGAVVKETQDATNKATIESSIEKAKKIRELENNLTSYFLTESQKRIDIEKAQGKDTLQLENDLLKEKISLNEKEVKNEGQSSAQKDAFAEELFKNKVALIANEFAIQEKAYNDSLAANQKFYNQQSKIITNSLKNELDDQTLNEEEKLEIQKTGDNQRFALSQKILSNEISLRKKHGEDVTALQATQAQNELDQQIKLEDERQQKLITDLEKEKQLRVLNLQDNFEGEAAYDEKISNLDSEFEAKRLGQIQKDGKEGLDIQQSINDKAIKAKIDETNKEIALQNFLVEKTKNSLSNIIQDTSESISTRMNAAEKLHDFTINNINDELQKTKVATLEYEQLNQQKAASDQLYAQTQKALSQQRKQQIASVEQAIGQAVQGGVDLFNQINANETAKAQKIVDNLTQQNTDLQTQIDATTKQAEDSLNKINSLENNLTNDRGERAAIEKQQLEDAREQTIKIQKEKTKLADQEIENQKKIDKENERIAKLKVQRQKVDKENAIAQSIINTAVGFTQALAQESVAGIVTGAIILAAGAAETAVIAATPVTGFYEGGYTNKHYSDKKAVGIVHSNEYVAPANVVRNPKGAYLISQLENLRTQGFSNGGLVPNLANFENINKTQLKAQSLVNELSQRPIVVGVDQISKVENQVSVIQNSAGF